jgi:hypothetical protein
MVIESKALLQKSPPRSKTNKKIGDCFLNIISNLFNATEYLGDKK